MFGLEGAVATARPRPVNLMRHSAILGAVGKVSLFAMSGVPAAIRGCLRATANLGSTPWKATNAKSAARKRRSRRRNEAELDWETKSASICQRPFPLELLLLHRAVPVDLFGFWRPPRAPPRTARSTRHHPHPDWHPR